MTVYKRLTIKNVHFTSSLWPDVKNNDFTVEVHFIAGRLLGTISYFLMTDDKHFFMSLKLFDVAENKSSIMWLKLVGSAIIGPQLMQACDEMFSDVCK